MGRVAFTKTLHMMDTPERCIELIRRQLLAYGMELRHGIDHEIEGYPGSKYETRVIGGWLIDAARLPIWVRIYCSAGPRGSTDAKIVLEEALAAESLETGRIRRYKSSFRKLLTALERSALSA